MAELYSIVLSYKNHLPRFDCDLFEKEGAYWWNVTKREMVLPLLETMGSQRARKELGMAVDISLFRFGAGPDRSTGGSLGQEIKLYVLLCLSNCCLDQGCETSYSEECRKLNLKV